MDLPQSGPLPRLSSSLPSRAQTVPARPGGIAGGWTQIRAFRQSASELLTGHLRDRPGVDEASRRKISRSLNMAMLRDHANNLLAWSADHLSARRFSAVLLRAPGGPARRPTCGTGSGAP